MLLEDALRTATLPFAESGRMVVIRRLPLGRLDSRAAGAALALRLERAVRDLAVSTVSFDSPAAAAAATVVFPDRATAVVGLARRFAGRQPVAEWFWPAALPGWNPQRSVSATWLWLLEEAHAESAAATTAAAVVAAAADAGRLDELPAAIPSRTVGRWWQAAGWNEPSARPHPAVPALSPLRLPCQSWLRQQLAAHAPPSPQLLWLATMLAVAERPARGADSALPAVVSAALAALSPEPDPGRRPAAPAVESPPPSPVRSTNALPSAAVAALSPAPESGPRPAPAAPSAESSPPAEDVRARTEPTRPRTDDRSTVPRHEPGEAPAPSTPADLEGDVSECAGVFLLVGLLQRLGFARWLERNRSGIGPEFPFRLLLFAIQRLGPRSPDPLYHLLERRLAESAGTPVSGAETAACLAWFAALRRTCRRRADLDLRSLVRRRGRVSVSRTHCDVCFPTDGVDLRIRRAGLDLDPGWVPWLGWVLRFHYVGGEDAVLR